MHCICEILHLKRSLLIFSKIQQISSTCLRCSEVLEKIIVLYGLLDQGPGVEVLGHLLNVDGGAGGDALAGHTLLLVQCHLTCHTVVILGIVDTSGIINYFSDALTIIIFKKETFILFRIKCINFLIRNETIFIR